MDRPKSPLQDKKITVAVAGNPNVGKSALFNALTGSHQHTGNWPGKTVERAEGIFHYQGWEIRLVDLPGTYSLAAQSLEEVIARDYILSGDPDVVIDIVDATSLERNLNLTLQVLELTDKVIVVLNLMDEVKRQGWEIDVAALEADLGVPVVPTIATEGEGLPELVAAIVEVATGERQTQPAAVNYGLTFEGYVETLEADLARLGMGGWRRWVALKLLEDDPQIVAGFQQGDLATCSLKSDKDALSLSSTALRALLRRAVRLREGIRPDAKVEIVRRRFEFAHDVVHRTAHRLRPVEESLTEKVDRIVTHKVWSWPIMLAMLTLVLWITVKGGEIGGSWLDACFSWLIHITRTWLTNIQAPWWVTGTLVDGFMMGTGTVIAAMLPPMIILFVAFDLLEDLGLLPRMAFNLDRPMQTVGSQGKQCLTWGMCLGCNVTGVMASRIIENKKARLVSILTAPLIICSGSYGAGVALAIALFGGSAFPVMLSLFAISLGVAFLATFILNKTIFRGEPGSFVLEMHPYRKPKFLRVIQRSLIDRVAETMWRAIEFAAPAAVVIWVLGNVPHGVPFDQTAIGWLVHGLEPLGQLWGLSGAMLAALLFALPAKEIIVPALAITYGLQASLSGSVSVLTYLSQAWTPLTSYTFLVFFMLYLPCLVTVWATWKETRSLKWTLMGLGVPLAMSCLVTLLVYQGGRVLSF